MKVFNYQFSLTILFALISIFLVKGQEVINITSQSFQSVVESSEFVLILFFEAGNARSKKVQSIVNDVVQRIKGEKLTYENQDFNPGNEILNKLAFAEIDGFKYQDLSNQFDVENFPSVIFYSHVMKLSEDITSGSDSVENLLKTIKNRLIRKSTEIKSLEDLKEINRLNSFNMLLCDNLDYSRLDSSNYFHAFVKYNHVFLSHFNINRNSTITKLLECDVKNPQLIIFNNIDNEHSKFFGIYDDATNLDSDTLNLFLSIYASPIVQDLSNKNFDSQILLQDSVNKIYIHKNDELSQKFKLFYTMAKENRKNKGEVRFYKHNIKEEQFSILQELFETEHTSTSSKYPIIASLVYKEKKLYKLIEDGNESDKEFENIIQVNTKNLELEKEKEEKNSNFIKTKYELKIFDESHIKRDLENININVRENININLNLNLNLDRDLDVNQTNSEKILPEEIISINSESILSSGNGQDSITIDFEEAQYKSDSETENSGVSNNYAETTIIDL
jgi:hypothetical protein